MESAPKDGRSILGTDGEEYAVVRWAVPGDYWTLSMPGRGAEDGEWWPTHFMDLPAPPQPGESNARFIAGPAQETK
jgi:hypothetical protein